MTALQRLQLKQSELRSKIAAELEKAAADREEGGLERMTREMQALEVEVRAALVIHEETAIPDSVESAPDSQGRELRSLFEQASISAYLNETAGNIVVGGAEKELRETLLGSNAIGYLPLDLLMDQGDERREYRADAVSNVAAAIQDNQMPIAQRVFAQGAAMYLGAMMPSVGVGDVTYPRLTAGTTANVRSDGVELDGAAATLGTETISPVRLTASYTFGLETLSRVQGYESALRMDIRSVLSDKLDDLIINGQAANGTTSPVVEGIISSQTNPTNPSDTAEWDDYLLLYDGAVDGKYAVDDRQVRLLVEPEVWRHAMSLTAGTSGRAGLLRDIIDRSRFRASANIDSTTGAGIHSVIRYASGASARARGFISPVWRGVQMIVDPYTLAKKGQKLITAIMMVGFAMVDDAAYTLAEVKIT